MFNNIRGNRVWIGESWATAVRGLGGLLKETMSDIYKYNLNNVGRGWMRAWLV